METEWEKIRSDYEQGMTFRDLEATHSVPRSTVCERAKRDGWTRVRVLSKRATSLSAFPGPAPTPSAVALAQHALADLSKLVAPGGLSVDEHAKLANALKAYSAVIAAAPQTEAQPLQGLYIDPSLLSDETLSRIEQEMSKVVHLPETG